MLNSLKRSFTIALRLTLENVCQIGQIVKLKQIIDITELISVLIMCELCLTGKKTECCCLCEQLRIFCIWRTFQTL